jgi:hypothetical protein
MRHLDKVLHFLVGGLITALLLPLGLAIALGVTLLAAIGKEVFDYFAHGQPDKIDAGVTVLGGLFSVGASHTLIWAFFGYF